MFVLKMELDQQMLDMKMQPKMQALGMSGFHSKSYLCLASIFPLIKKSSGALT
jgi:hypothetical protein